MERIVRRRGSVSGNRAVLTDRTSATPENPIKRDAITIVNTE